ncbi:MAG: 2-C-methyl-D-erythritol 4-phosphate cytidylyltransferase [Solirubrobacterales bacterium]
MGSSPVAVTAVIAAAGSGQRLGAGGPQAFVPLAGKAMIEWSIEAFGAAEPVRSIVVACPPGHAPGLGGEGLTVVDGGEARAESVANALEAVDTELVAIHDAARPLVTAELVEAVIAMLCADPEADGAIAATPVTDTIKQVGAGKQVGKREEAGGEGSKDLSTSFGPHRVLKSSTDVETTLDRGRLWAAQTPQVFRTEALRAAIDAAESAAASGGGVAAATDEAMLIEEAGGRVLIYPSLPENLKVTTPLDLKMAELLLNERSAQ